MLSFATDTWTSPNHKPYMAITVHFQKGGVPKSLLLDMVDVRMSHTGKNLASVFERVLREFQIEDKVSEW